MDSKKTLLVGVVVLLTLTLCSGLFAQASCTPAPSGIVSWWPLDTVSGTTTPDIVGTNNGTLVNGPVLVPGKVGNALSFNGINQCVNLGNSATLKLTSAVTVDAWVYIDPNAANLKGNVNHIVSNRGAYFPIGGYTLYWDDRPQYTNGIGKSIKFIVGDSDGSYAQAELDNAITSAGWYDLAGTYDVSAGNVILYINGAAVASAPYNKQMGVFPNDMFVGADNGTTSFFEGIIDEVAIFNRALAPAEVMSIYNAGSAGMCRDVPIINAPLVLADGEVNGPYSQTFTAVLGTPPYGFILAPTSGPLPPGLALSAGGVISGTPTTTGTFTFTVMVTDSVGKFSQSTFSIAVFACTPAPSGIVSWWPFDTVSNNVTPDIIGTNPGTLVNSPQLVVGKVGNALGFNGINQCVNLGNSATLKLTNAVTVNAWVYIDPNAANLVGNVNHIISNQGLSYPVGGYTLYWDDRPQYTNGIGKSIKFIVGYSDGSYAQAELDNAITSAGWYNLAGTYDVSAGNVILYINGAAVASAPYNKQMGVFPNDIFVGADNGTTSFFEGIIDEVAIFNRALAPAEVMSIYNASSAGMCVVNTPAGSNITVNLGSGVTVTFSNVTTPGVTTLTTSNNGPSPGDVYVDVNRFSGAPPIYYYIQTTAMYSGPIQITIYYNPAGLNSVQESHLKIYHYGVNLNPVNITDTSVSPNPNTTYHYIVGVSTSLSPFAVGIPIIPAGVSIEPRVINLRAQGVYTASITLPSGYLLSDIDASTITANGFPVKAAQVAANNKFVADFDRAGLVNTGITGTAGTREVTIRGSLKNGLPFAGTAIVNVMN